MSVEVKDIEFSFDISEIDSDNDALESRLDAVIEKMADADISELQWQSFITANDCANILRFGKLLESLPTSSDPPLKGKKRLPFDKALRIVAMLSSLQPEDSYLALGSKTQCADALSNSIQTDQIDAKKMKIYKPRMRLLSELLILCPTTELVMLSFPQLVANLLEKLSSHVIELFNESVRCLVCSHRHCKSDLLVIKSALESDSLRLFSETLVQLVNNAQEDDFLIPTLDFVQSIFESGNSEFFYSNDILVLIEVLFRRINDSEEGSKIMLHHLNTMCAVLQWPSYTEKSHLADEILETLDNLLRNAAHRNDEEAVKCIEFVVGQTLDILDPDGAIE